MKTQTRKKRATLATKQRATRKVADTKKQAAATKSNEAYIQIPLGKIVFSPLNYRKYFSPQALEDFAQELQTHGIISPVTVRPLPAGKYELVAGERRARAARMAGLKTIPAVIKTLSDEAVREIQLAENIQRENPHPMHEARAINDMLQSGKSVEEAALRLGKSKAFVYNRMKLAALIEPLQLVFLADKMTIQQAFEIARLQAEGQQELFEQYFANWEKEGFKTGNLNYILDRFRYDLRRAPFSLKSKKLLPEAGACIHCPFNSATLKALFPEFSKEAVCSNKSCYQSKCQAHFVTQLHALLSENNLDAVISLNGEVPDILKTLGEDRLAELPVYGYYDISVQEPPEEPLKDDYMFEEDEEGEEPDENGYREAVAEYEEEKLAYEELLNSGHLKKGLYINNGAVSMLLFSEGKRSANGQTATVTAKEVQEAIKAGHATPELLQSEIDRLNARETRAKELDAEKLQLKVHEQFTAFCEDTENMKGLTRADMAAARLLVYQNLGYTVRRQVDNFLFPQDVKEAGNHNLFEMLANITETQFSYLIRMAIIGKPESKSPRDSIGYSLYTIAGEAGLDIAGIEQEQEEKVTEREDRLAVRIKDLEKRIAKLNKALELIQAG